MRWKPIVLMLLIAAASAAPAAAKAPISAGITSLDTSCTGITVSAHGSDPNRIASSSFTLGIVQPDGSVTPIDGKTVTYSTPLPRVVDETWSSSTPLVPGVTYRVVFAIFERDGTSPASAAGDFTCT